ncbi:hypothetical protein FACS189443_1780 [Planctomycetales bacterium]|nr:hypothetical protein FACS189443_1780 [Planctomycetales bacterium]
MANDPRNLNWADFNAVRRFPLLYGCDAVSTDGHFTIPDNLILSLYLSYHLGETFPNPSMFYISELVYFRSGFTLSISYRNGGTVTKIAETSVDLTSSTRHSVINFVDSTGGQASGFFVLGDIDALDNQPVGEWTFEPEATTLDPFCIRAAAPALSRIFVQTADQLYGPFIGDITFAEGENITLDVLGVDEMNCLEGTSEGTEIVISTEVEQDKNTNCVKSILGVLPDNHGNIEFIGQNCLEITPFGASGILFNDKCSEPCCSCAELAPSEAKMSELTVSISQLSARINALDNQMQMIQTALLMSN